MSKRIEPMGKRMKGWWENHPVVVTLGILLFLMAFVVTANSMTALVEGFVRDHITWKGVEQVKIDKLAPEEPIAYFTSVLGQPILINKTGQSSAVTEYIYRERGYWVVAYSNDQTSVQLMAITACGDQGFYPLIKNNPVGGTIQLSKTKMKYAATLDSFGSLGQPSTEFTPHYFLSGATAPSYYYDEYYYGNPSRYQTVFAGSNEICGLAALPESIRDVLDEPLKEKLSTAQVNYIRSNVLVNTYAVTAPFQGFSYNQSIYKQLFGDGAYSIGVSYLDASVLGYKPNFSR